jgi:hypothetical protein
MRHLFKLCQHWPLIFGFVYPTAFWHSNIVIGSILFHCFHWSAYVTIAWTASQTHYEVLPMLFQPLQHFIYVYIAAFVFKLQIYLENRERLLPPHLEL